MSTADMHHGRCSVSVHIDMSVAITEQCMDKDRHWTVKEMAKHTGISRSTALETV